ncbi:lens fiber membrane intrinsic protein-like [Lissotriton helveticus]
MIALKVSGLLLSLISTIALIVSIATNHWAVTRKFYFGLWVACFDAFSESFCNSISSVSVYLNVTRAFLIIALVFLVLAVSTQISVIKGQNSLGKMNMQKQAGSWSLNAGVFTVIGMSVFTATSGINPRTDYYSWSYALGWVSAAVSLVAGIIGYYVFKKEIPALLAQPEPVTGQATQIMANPYTVQPGAVQQYPVQPGVIQLYPRPPVPNQPYPGSTEGFVPYHEAPPAYAPQPDLALPYPQYPVQAAFPPQPEKRF